MADNNKTVNLYINTKGASASIKELQSDYRKLSNEIAKLDPTSQEFIDKSKDFKTVSDRLTQVRNSVKGIQDEVKGGSSIFSNFKGMFMAAFSVGAAIEAGKAVIGFFKDSVQASMEFKKSLSDLSAITGAEGEDLKFLSDSAKETAKETGIAAKDIVEAYKLIASAKPELLKDKEALAALTQEAITLSKASGMDLPSAAKSLTDALNQFGAPASQAGRYINVLAAASKEGAAEIPQVTDALKQFGVMAKSQNVSIEESAALIETLAEKGKQGADAGVALRNVLAKLSAPDTLPKTALTFLKSAGVDLKVLSDTTVPFAQRLQELSKIQGNASAITEVFGLENQNVAQILIENRQRFKDLTQAITDTTVAEEQARVATDNWAGDKDKFFAVLNEDMLEIGESSDSVLRDITQFATEVLKNTEPVGEAFSSYTRIFGTLFDAIGRVLSIFFPFDDKASGTATTMKLLGTVINTAILPLKIFALVVTTVLDTLSALLNKAKEAVNFFGADFKIDPEATFGKSFDRMTNSFKEMGTSYKQIWEDNKKVTEDATDKIAKEVEDKFNNMNKAMQNSLQGAVLGAPKPSTTDPKKNAALRQQMEGMLNVSNMKSLDKDGNEVAAKKTKDQIEAEQKAAQEAQKIREAAAKNILKLQQQNLADAFDIKMEMLKSQAEQEIAMIKGTEMEKAAQIKAIQDKLAKDLFDEQTANLRKKADAEKLLVTGNAEQIDAQKKLIETAFLNDVKKLQIKYDEDKLKRELAYAQKEADERQKAEELYRQKQYNAQMATLDAQIVMQKGHNQKILNLQLQKLDLEKQKELENTNLTDEEKQLIDVKYNEKAEELKKQSLQKTLGQIEQAGSQALQILGNAVQAIQQMNDAKYQREIQQSEDAKNANIASLDTELKQKRISQEQYDKAVKKAQDKATAEQNAIKNKQAQSDKKAQVAMAVINAAQAVLRSLSGAPFPFNLVLAAATAAIGAIQVATVVKTPIPKYAKGGSTASNKGALPKGRTQYPTIMHGGPIDQPVIAEVGEAGPEYVIPNWMLRNNKIADMVGVMEAVRTGKPVAGFAVGGFTSGSGQPSASVAASNADKDSELLQALLMQVAGLRADVKAWNTVLSATINYDQFTKANDLVETIKNESKL